MKLVARNSTFRQHVVADKEIIEAVYFGVDLIPARDVLLVTGCRNLRHLDLSLLLTLTNVHFGVLCRYLAPLLESLVLRGAFTGYPSLSDSGIQHLGTHAAIKLTSLTMLHMGGTVSSRGSLNEVCRGATNLMDLHLGGVVCEDGLGISLAQHCKNLTRIAGDDKVALTELGMEALLIGCQELASLDLPWREVSSSLCHNVAMKYVFHAMRSLCATDMKCGDLCAIVQPLPNLTTLDMSSNGRSLDQRWSLRTMASVALSCEKLRTLHINRARLDGQASLALTRLKLLTTLHMSHSAASSPALSAVIQACDALTDLDLSHSPGVDNLVLAAMGDGLPLLKKVCLSHDVHFHDGRIFALVKCCHHLTKLDLNGCYQISDLTVLTLWSMARDRAGELEIVLNDRNLQPTLLVDRYKEWRNEEAEEKRPLDGEEASPARPMRMYRNYFGIQKVGVPAHHYHCWIARKDATVIFARFEADGVDDVPKLAIGPQQLARAHPEEAASFTAPPEPHHGGVGEADVCQRIAVRVRKCFPDASDVAVQYEGHYSEVKVVNVLRTLQQSAHVASGVFKVSRDVDTIAPINYGVNPSTDLEHMHPVEVLRCTKDWPGVLADLPFVVDFRARDDQESLLLLPTLRWSDDSKEKGSSVPQDDTVRILSAAVRHTVELVLESQYTSPLSAVISRQETGLFPAAHAQMWQWTISLSMHERSILYVDASRSVPLASTVCKIVFPVGGELSTPVRFSGTQKLDFHNGYRAEVSALVGSADVIPSHLRPVAKCFGDRIGAYVRLLVKISRRVSMDDASEWKSVASGQSFHALVGEYIGLDGKVIGADSMQLICLEASSSVLPVSDAEVDFRIDPKGPDSLSPADP